MRKGGGLFFYRIKRLKKKKGRHGNGAALKKKKAVRLFIYFYRFFLGCDTKVIRKTGFFLLFYFFSLLTYRNNTIHLNFEDEILFDLISFITRCIVRI